MPLIIKEKEIVNIDISLLKNWTIQYTYPTLELKNNSFN